jgi:AcrR family transcriptional regulator
MVAAAELIAELGWGRVTTRAVADRAELPHGAVSYHFRGKQELLTESALHAFQQVLPVEEFEALTTVEDLIGMIFDQLANLDPVASRLMLESMREAERDPLLRDRMRDLLDAYRRLMIDAVRADQARGAVFNGAPPEAIATVLGAAGDGLLLHMLLDPELDIAAAVAALRALLAPRDMERPRS